MEEDGGMTTSRRSRKAGRLSADDWIEAATQAIVTGGIAAVAVEPLAQRLGVTKGSFYWHFANRDALLKATIERWEREDTEAAIAMFEAIPDPRERLHQLIVQALRDAPPLGEAPAEHGFGYAFHLALSDAADDPVVRPILHRVSERRLDYLSDCFRAVGLAPDEAQQRALLAYAAYIGTLHLFREAPSRAPVGELGEAYRQHLVHALLPAETGDRGQRTEVGSRPIADSLRLHESTGDGVT
jgi:AcrR family transcriptional regulator